MPVPGRRLRRLPSPLLLGLLASLPGPASSGERVLAVRIAGFGSDQLRVVRFQVERPVAATLEGIGAGSPNALYAYGWLVRFDEHSLVWSMVGSDPEGGRKQGGSNLRFRQAVELRPGSYGLYYFAGHHALAPGARGLIELFHPRHEQPEAWQLGLFLDEPAAGAVTITPPDVVAAAEPGTIRLAPLGDNSLVRRRFRLSAAGEVEIFAQGESDLRGQNLADRAWLLELASRRLVWSLADHEATPAGGARKNRAVRTRLSLEAGAYELAAATDDSHSPDAWNALPPYFPHDWGVTLTAPPELVGEDDVPAERVIVRLTGVGDSESFAATFRLDRSTPVRVYALGEWSSSDGSLADYGWIEDAGSGATIWKMAYEGSGPAGGAAKNRAVDTVVDLPAGTYRLRYRSDDSHSAMDWNSAPPSDPHGWGISLSTFDPAARWELLDWQTGADKPGVERDDEPGHRGKRRRTEPADAAGRGRPPGPAAGYTSRVSPTLLSPPRRGPGGAILGTGSTALVTVLALTAAVAGAAGAPGETRTAEKARSYLASGIRDYRAERFAPALAAFEMAIGLARFSITERQLMADALHLASASALRGGRPEVALRHAQEYARWAEESGQDRDRARAANDLVESHLAQGSLQPARRLHAAAAAAVVAGAGDGEERDRHRFLGERLAAAGEGTASPSPEPTLNERPTPPREPPPTATPLPSATPEPPHPPAPPPPAEPPHPPEPTPSPGG